MGLLIFLAVLAIPLVLVGLITKWRGGSYRYNDEWAPHIDRALGRTETSLAELVDEKKDDAL
jgi:hypothetical protein